MTIPQKRLIIYSIVLVGMTFGVFTLLPLVVGPKWGYVLGFFLYWVSALFFSNRLNGFDPSALKNMYTPPSGWKLLTASAAAFLPVIGVFFVSFVPNVNRLTVLSGLFVILMSVCNGLVEEYFWRGMYLLQFKESAVIFLIVSPLLFGIYHIALWFINGITYQGGFFALVGGAYIMGVLWAWVSRKTGSILAVTIAHVLVNIFAFTGLFVQNGF